MNNDKHARTRALFERAVAAIAALPASAAPNESISLSNQQLLHFYSLYKQATQGDLPTSSLRRPGLFDLRGRAKYDAWLARQGTPQHVAMRQYVDLFMAFLRKFPDRPIAQQLLAEFVSEGAMVSQVASTVSAVHASSSSSSSDDDDDDDSEHQQELRHQEVMDQTRAPLGQPSATTRRRASIATLETDAGANSFYSATATADEDEGEDASASDMSQDLSASSDDDDDGSETASETMVVSAPDTSLISPGPVPKPVGGHHHHHHHVHHRPHGPGSSSSSTSLNTAFYRPDDTRSVTSVATVRPPPRSPPPVPSDLGRSWVAPDRPARIPSPTSTRPAPAAAVPARDFGSREGTAAAASVSLTRDAASSTNVADLQAQIARLQSQLAASSASPSTMAKRSSAGLFVRMLHASGRWLVRSVVAWIVLATVGRELRARNNKVYRVLEWLVKVAVGVESL